MNQRFPKDPQRADLLAYLGSLSANPVPFPEPAPVITAEELVTDTIESAEEIIEDAGGQASDAVESVTEETEEAIEEVEEALIE